MKPSILTVSQVNFFLKSLIESDGRLNNILISGEISNYTDHYKSGHLYFSLKDDKSAIKVVMFSGAARRLKFRPSDGMKVIIRGRVSVYEASGQYQLYAEEMQPDGVGALSIAYEQLKSRLAQEGLFDEGGKKPIPKYPQRIGVITSPTGAAVQDILQITARRWPLSEIVFCPVLVQGEGAPAQLVHALRGLNRLECCDVIILGRGGGSIEDLWAFNNEELAREVFASEIPVVSAVGHETDFTICDFVADLRAPTPSAAAELCTPDQREELSTLSTYQEYFSRKPKQYLEYLRQCVDILLSDSPLGQPCEYLNAIKDELCIETDNLCSAIWNRIEKEKKQLQVSSATLDALSPLRVLGRGYAVALREDGSLLRRAKEAVSGEILTLCLADGAIKVEAKEGVEKNEQD